MKLLQREFSKLRNSFSKSAEIYIFLAIIVVGSVVRISVIPTTLWYGDVARDLLVSEHIFRYHEIPNIGHVASGTNPIFYYPPIYYFFLTLLKGPFMSIWYLTGIFVFLAVISLGLLYLINRQLFGVRIAMIATSLFALSPFYIDRQTTISSMHFTLPIFLGGTLLHLTGIQRRDKNYLFVGLFLLVVASSINYAALICIPIFLLWILVKFRKLRNFFNSTTFVITCFYILYLPFAYFVTVHYGFDAFLFPFLPSSNVSPHSNVLLNIVTEYRKIVMNVFPAGTSVLMILFPIVLLVAQFRRKKTFPYLYVLGFIVLTLLLSAMKNKPTENYYYFLMDSFFISAICASFVDSFGFSIACVAIVSFFCWSNASSSLALVHREPSYQKTQTFMNAIVQKLQSTDPHLIQGNQIHFQFAAENRLSNDWDGLKYSFFLEKRFGKVFRIYDHYDNLQWITPDTYIVILCLVDYMTTPSYCLDYFKYYHPNHKLLKQFVLEDGKRLYIFTSANK